MAMFENFPYTDMHNLNLDWIIKIAKDFLDQYTHIQQLIADGETSLTNLTESGLTQLQDKADTLEGLLQAWYDTHSSDIADQLADALADMASTLSAYTNEFYRLADAKAAETIASIPDDYTALSNQVTALENCFTTTGTINNVFTNIRISGRLTQDLNFNNARNEYNGSTGFMIRGTDQNVDLYDSGEIPNNKTGHVDAQFGTTTVSFDYDLTQITQGTRLLAQTGFIIKKDCYNQSILPFTVKALEKVYSGDLLPNDSTLYTTGKYYGHGDLNIGTTSSATVLTFPIPVLKDVEYYYANIYAYFSNIKYNNNTIAAISNSTEPYNYGTFTPTNDGYLYVTLPTNSTAILSQAVIRPVNDDTIFINPSDDVIGLMLAGAGRHIHFNAGTYNIIQLYKNRYGSTFFDTYAGYSGRGIEFAGLPVKRNTHITASTGARFQCYYAGENTSVPTNFAAFALEGGVTLENLFIVGNNIRNCIHDDFDNSFEGITIIRNCTLVNDNIVLAGGLAIHDTVYIENCICHNQNVAAVYDFSYHNNGDADAQSKIIIRDNYCINTIRVAYYGSSTKKTDVIITNNSVNAAIIHGAESGATVDNLTWYDWNNEIR